MSHRFNRRQFLLATTTALPLAFMGSHSRATSRTGRLATPTTTACPRSATETPKISVSRPPIVGILGQTYFKVEEGRPDQWFTHVFPGMEIWLDGVNQHCHSFELDLEGGWVGLYAVNCAERKTSRQHTPERKRWVRGVITLKRRESRIPQIGDPHPSSVKFTVDSVDYTAHLKSIRIDEMRQQFREQLERNSLPPVVGEITGRLIRH